MRLSRLITSAGARAMVDAAAALSVLHFAAPIGEQPYGRHSAERLAKPKPKKRRKFKGSRAAKKASRP